MASSSTIYHNGDDIHSVIAAEERSPVDRMLDDLEESLAKKENDVILPLYPIPNMHCSDATDSGCGDSPPSLMPLKRNRICDSPALLPENSSPILDVDAFRKLNAVIIGRTSKQEVIEVNKWMPLSKLLINHLMYSCQVFESRSAQKYVWPDVYKGRSVTYIGPPKTGKSTAYLIPILSCIISRQQEPLMLSEGDDRGIDCPSKKSFFLIVCPSRETCGNIWNLIEKYTPPSMHRSKSNGIKMVKLVSTADLNNPETKIQKTIIKGDVNFIIGTPEPVLAAVKSSVIDMSLCEKLILEDVDKSLLIHQTSMKLIYLKYAESVVEKYKRTMVEINKLTNGIGSTSKISAPDTLQQVKMIAVGEKLTCDLKKLHEETQPDNSSVLVITDQLEAAIWGRVEFKTFFCKNLSEKGQNLLKAFEFASSVVDSHIIVCVQDREEMRMARCFLQDTVNNVVVAPQYVQDFGRLRNKWLDKSGSQQENVHPNVLIIDDPSIPMILSHADIKDARALIHYSVPDVKGQFAKRINLMSSIINKSNMNKLSILLIGPEDKVQAHELVDLMDRLSLDVDPDLLRLRNDNPRGLCRNLAATGSCALQKYFCFDDHFLTESKDTISLPKTGQVKFKVRYVASASEIFININSHRASISTDSPWIKSPSLNDIQDQLDALLKDSQVTKAEVQKGDLFALYRDGKVVRVQIIEMGNPQFDRISLVYRQYYQVFHVDSGKVTTVEKSALLELPQLLKEFPFLAVRAFIVGLKPLENDVSWSPEATEFARTFFERSDIVNMTAWVYYAADVGGKRCLWLDGIRIYNYLNELALETTIKYVDYIIDYQKGVVGPKLPYTNVTPYDGFDSEIMWTLEWQMRKKQLAFLPEEDTIEVFLIYFKEFHDFYLRLVANDDILNDLEKDIQKSSLKPLGKSLKKGLICVYRYSSTSFNRVQICGFHDDGIRVFVFCVDYGENFYVYPEDLFHLESRFFTRLPFQAIKCEIHDMMPLVQQDDLQEAMYDLTRQSDNTFKTLLCKRVDKSKDPFHVNLYVKIGNDATDDIFSSLKKLAIDKGIAALDGDRDIGQEVIRLKKALVDQEEDTNDPDDDEHLCEAEKLCKENFFKPGLDSLEQLYPEIKNSLGIHDKPGFTSQPARETDVQIDGQEEEEEENPGSFYRFAPPNAEDLIFDPPAQVNANALSCYDPDDIRHEVQQLEDTDFLDIDEENFPNELYDAQ